MTLEVGSKAPNFSGLTADNEPISLKDFQGKIIVLYFYPKDNTPGCTREACDFRDNMSKLCELGVQIIGVSKDSGQSHRKFQDKYNLPFPLIADTDESICNAFGVISDKKLYGKIFKGIVRSTFLIDQQGIIRHIWRKVKVNGHVNEVINAINAW